MAQNGVSVVRPDVPGQVCIKIREGEREVSISCDDSAGALFNYERADVRCYVGKDFEKDVTHEVFPPGEYGISTVRCEVDELLTALAWLRQPHVEEELAFNRSVMEDMAKERGLDVKLEELRDERRKLEHLRAALKARDFAINYGMGPTNLSRLFQRVRVEQEVLASMTPSEREEYNRRADEEVLEQLDALGFRPPE